ncbi:hypothetical protein [Argonema galeatum]|uniref:hypothetical protein n=1 Tax=Argonema galeatum TaxID=2942762 RepID=UPI002012D4B6|nr:hypothetical protein [Argonema galeatum]MCL1468255.1 hypothetical protein [Argonema galeatum A003/A1]
MIIYMRKQRLFWLALALLLIALSWWGVAAARSGLVVRSIQRNGVPMLYIAPQPSGKIPDVLVAHGFGSAIFFGWTIVSAFPLAA